MISGSIPKRYARALMAHIKEKGLDVAQLSEELRSFSRQLEPGAELHDFFSNKLIPGSRKSVVLGSLIDNIPLSSSLINFLKLLQKKDRLLYLPSIYTEFRRLADDLEGIVRGEVMVSSDIPREIIEALRVKLSDVMAKKVILTVTKNPAVIGGVVVKVGSLSFDGSIRAQIDSIKETLIERVNF